MFLVYVAFTFEDILERKSVAMSSTARAPRTLAAGFSSRAWNGLNRTRFQSVGLKSPIEVLAFQLSFAIQVYKGLIKRMAALE